MTAPADASKPFVASPAVEAVRMLEVFASVGAEAFDITHTHLSGQARGFRCNRSVEEATRSMPYLVASAVKRQNNVIVRPRVQGATCIQLDDLDKAKAQAVAPAAFLILETSPRNYQAWVTVADAPLGFTARLRRGAGADLNASGATRVAGTYNFKPKYAPHFPIVRMAATRRGHIVSVADLETLGVVAPELIQAAAIDTGRPGRGPARAWPSYQQCLDGAPEGPSGNPSRTSVDFVFCKIAASWGHSIEATAAKLMQESSKAQENGEAYAIQTAKRAAWAAEQRNRQQNPRP